MKTNKLFFCFALIAISVLNFKSYSQTADEMSRSRQFEKQANAHYKAKNFAGFLSNIKQAADLRPNHSRLLYNSAVGYALNNQPDAALETLERLAVMNLYFDVVADEDFAALKKLKRFKEAQIRFDRNRQPINKSVRAFSLPDKDLITESVAFDPKSNRFFVSSVHQKKIFAVDKNKTVSEFSAESDGLWSVLGMKVDERRQILWVCSAAFPQMRGFKKENDGKSGIFKYDLATGKLLGKYLLGNESEKHALGDLIVNTRGDVFATDSVSAKIYSIDSQTDRLEVFLENDFFESPQGLTFTPDEKFMYVADYSKGIFKIEIKTRKMIQLAPANDVTVLGIDGLYFHRGKLVAIQNGTNPPRVLQLSFNENQITKSKTLETNHADFNEPTLGVVVGEDFYFIANSQWNNVNEKGELAVEKLREPLILRLKL